MTVTSNDAPNAARCANNATNPPVTLGTRSTARAPSWSPRATATIARIDRVIVSGPRSPGANRVSAAAASSDPTTAHPVTKPDPRLFDPNTARSPTADPAPMTEITAPSVVATALPSTRCCRGTTCGSAAESPESTNRLMPIAISAPT